MKCFTIYRKEIKYHPPFPSAKARKQFKAAFVKYHWQLNSKNIFVPKQIFQYRIKIKNCPGHIAVGCSMKW